jgi:hypothetical protein
MRSLEVDGVMHPLALMEPFGIDQAWNDTSHFPTSGPYKKDEISKPDTRQCVVTALITTIETIDTSSL